MSECAVCMYRLRASRGGSAMRWLARSGSYGPAAVAAEHFAQGGVLLIVAEIAGQSAADARAGIGRKVGAEMGSCRCLASSAPEVGGQGTDPG